MDIYRIQKDSFTYKKLAHKKFQYDQNWLRDLTNLVFLKPQRNIVYNV